MQAYQTVVPRLLTVAAPLVFLALITPMSSVLADAPPCRYTFPTADTVRDTDTGLVWQRATDIVKFTRADAATYCQGLSLDGTGWRLPTIKELLTIVDTTKTNPSIDATAFPSTPAEHFWASSPYVLTANYAWNVDFSDGSSYGGDVTAALRVRCVR